MIIDELFQELSKITNARTAREVDLATLVKRLCRRLDQVSKGETIVSQATGYLERQGLGPAITDILRGDEPIK
jgi:hypothetical protein